MALQSRVLRILRKLRKRVRRRLYFPGKYAGNCLGLLRGRPAPASWQVLADLPRNYGYWKSSLAAADWTALDAEVPWITLPAAKFVEDRISPDWDVFEFGAGGSSLYFARRVRSLTTVEHDPRWYILLQERHLFEKFLNWRCILSEPVPHARSDLDASNPSHYTSASNYGGPWRGKDFRDYCRSVTETGHRDFDLVLVDGRARPGCLMEAIPMIRPGGALLLDNSGRPRYRGACALPPPSWKRYDFPGPTLKKRDFELTTAWVRPATTEGAKPSSTRA